MNSPSLSTMKRASGRRPDARNRLGVRQRTAATCGLSTCSPASALSPSWRPGRHPCRPPLLMPRPAVAVSQRQLPRLPDGAEDLHPNPLQHRDVPPRPVSAPAPAIPGLWHTCRARGRPAARPTWPAPNSARHSGRSAGRAPRRTRRPPGSDRPTGRPPPGAVRSRRSRDHGRRPPARPGHDPGCLGRPSAHVPALPLRRPTPDAGLPGLDLGTRQGHPRRPFQQGQQRHVHAIIVTHRMLRVVLPSPQAVRRLRHPDAIRLLPPLAFLEPASRMTPTPGLDQARHRRAGQGDHRLPRGEEAAPPVADPSPRRPAAPGSLRTPPGAADDGPHPAHRRETRFRHR